MQEQKNKNPLLKTLLKNTAGSAIKFTNTSSEMDSRKCPACKAARPHDNDIRTCSYCGHAFMSDSVDLKPGRYA